MSQNYVSLYISFFPPFSPLNINLKCSTFPTDYRPAAAQVLGPSCSTVGCCCHLSGNLSLTLELFNPNLHGCHDFKQCCYDFLPREWIVFCRAVPTNVLQTWLKSHFTDLVEIPQKAWCKLGSPVPPLCWMLRS